MTTVSKTAIRDVPAGPRTPGQVRGDAAALPAAKWAPSGWSRLALFLAGFVLADHPELGQEIAAAIGSAIHDETGEPT